MLNPNSLIPKPPVGRSEYGRIKVALPRGKGLMDWVRLTTGKVLAKKCLPGVDEKELAKHCSQEDCWIVLFNQVYDVTSYLDFHPGGIPELLRAAGRDATPLFNQYHAWVNYENMLKACLVGPFSGDINKLPPCGPSTIDDVEVTSSIDSFATPSGIGKDCGVQLDIDKNKLIVTSNLWSGITCANVIVNVSELQSHLRVLVRPFKQPSQEIIVPFFNKSLIKIPYSVTVKSESVVICFNLEENILSSAVNLKTRLIRKNPAVQYYKCNIETISRITHDTLLYTLTLPRNIYFSVPLGHHVSMKVRKGNATLYRPYTPTVCSPKTEEAGSIQFMIKIYPDGICTPSLSDLKEGDFIEISDPIGDIDVGSMTTNEVALVILAAGTGITPMIPILSCRMKDIIRPPTKLLLFNKAEKDIIDDKYLPFKWTTNDFEITHVLSSPSDKWDGFRGRVDISHLPTPDELTQVLICGPDGFIDSALKLLEEQSFNMERVHVFQG